MYPATLIKKKLATLMTLTPKEPDSSDSRSTDADVSNGLSSVSLPDTVARIANQMFHWKLQSYKTVDRQYRKGAAARNVSTKAKSSRACSS